MSPVPGAHHTAHAEELVLPSVSIGSIPADHRRERAAVTGHEWDRQLARLMANALDILDQHRHDDRHICRACAQPWPCQAACTAEMNLSLVRH